MKKEKAVNPQTAQEKKSRVVLHWIGNVVGILLIAILLPIVIINMTLIIKSYTKPDQVPTFAGVAPLIVQSGSMMPAIQVNDLIFTSEVDADDLKERDVIAFLPENSTTVVTHRIVRIETDENGNRLLITKGDFNNSEDADPVRAHQLVGRYFGRIGGAGKVATFLQQPLGMIIFVAVPLVLFLLYDLIRRLLYSRKKKGDEQAVNEELERLRALAAGAGLELPNEANVPEADQAPAPDEPDPGEDQY